MKDINTEALKPCPFCKNASVFAYHPDGDRSVWVVGCSKCSAEGPRNRVKSEAISAWNKSADHPTMVEISPNVDLIALRREVENGYRPTSATIMDMIDYIVDRQKMDAAPPPAVTDISGQEGERGPIDANRLEQMAKERPNECFLKGSGVLKLLSGIRQLEAEIRALSQPPANPCPLCDGHGTAPVWAGENKAQPPAVQVPEWQCDRDKLLTIIAYAYQIAGAHEVPAHILDVLSDPEGATGEQVEAMLPYIPASPSPAAKKEGGDE